MRVTGRGVVASGHPLVSEAAAELMRAGGNAFDAAVAAGFASAVAEPMLTSLGGGGFLLARCAAGEELLFDFFVDTPGRERSAGELAPHFVPVTVHFPSSDQVFNVGLGSVAVPGTLAGLLHVHRRLGCCPLREVLAPAVRLAREGVPLNHHQAYFLRLLTPIATMSEAGRALFTQEGRLLGEGERLGNDELACFLESLGPEGEGARDLAEYRVIERRPLVGRYRGHRLLTNPPPSFGGSLLALSLKLLDEAPLPGGTRTPEGATALLALFERVDEARREGHVCFRRGTTHVSVSDAQGNVASMSTSNGEGSGYLVPGTGISLNNMLGEDDLHPDGFHAAPPGERVASMMSPSLLVREGRVELVLGSGGSKRIRSALLQVIAHVLDAGLPVDEAVEHPRLHWDGERVQLEPGFPPAVASALRRQRPVVEWTTKDVYFGGVHAVLPGRRGAGDSRRGGAAALVEGAPPHPRPQRGKAA
jgi:gamma-glutamyltranspeptidase/glutathione hydrolase